MPGAESGDQLRDHFQTLLVGLPENVRSLDALTD